MLSIRTRPGLGNFGLVHPLALTIHIRFYLDRVFDPNWPHVGLDRAIILAEPVLSLSWRRTSILLLPETMEQPQTSSFFIFFLK